VAYDTRGFLEKNRDKFPDDLLELMQGSGNPLVAALFESESGTPGMPFFVPCLC
jgi:myosin-7